MALDAPKTALQTIGSYDILAKIAEGGMGTVYKARHQGTGQVVAIKIVPPSAARNPTLLKRFEREFTAARNLDHAHIVKAIEFDGDCPTPFLVMEFVDGESLGQRIERDGKLPEDEALRLITQVAQGLYRAHKQGLVHRDVKPDNILVNREGQAKLTDLGLVKDATDDYNLTRTGRGLGTPHFMAPEQFKHAKNADIRCDIYSLGATLYMAVTGQTPFGNCSALDCYLKKMRGELTAPKEVVPALSERADWAIRRAMSPNAEQRPATCREFVEDLYGRTTRPSQAQQIAASGDIWYLVYRDELGQSHTVKGGTDGIRRALQDGLLGDASTMTACRQKAGPFQELKAFPEFRDLLISPEALPPASSTPTRQAPRLATPPPAAVPPPLPPLSSRSTPAAGTEPPPLKTWRQAVNKVPSPSASGRLPHVPIEPVRRPGFDILMWVIVLLGALAVALAVFKFFPPR
jgi:serine/threonine protein kinase